MDREKITPRVIGARQTIGMFMRGADVTDSELQMAFETLTAAGVFDEIDAVVAAQHAPRRRLGRGIGAGVDG